MPEKFKPEAGEPQPLSVEEQEKINEFVEKEHQRNEKQIEDIFQRFQDDPDDLAKMIEDKKDEALGRKMPITRWHGEKPSIEEMIGHRRSSMDLAKHEVLIFEQALKRIKNKK